MINPGSRNVILKVVLGALAIIVMGCIYFYFASSPIVEMEEGGDLSKLIVDKNQLMLKVVNKEGDTIMNFPVAVGTNYGDKKRDGDLRTPEGAFKVTSIEKSSSWTYDFEDDNKGPIKGAYGPWFIRLDAAPHQGIGIHGTHDNSTIGKRVSHGCIRMRNKDLQKLKPLISKGTVVIITEDDPTQRRNSRINHSMHQTRNLN